MCDEDMFKSYHTSLIWHASHLLRRMYIAQKSTSHQRNMPSHHLPNPQSTSPWRGSLLSDALSFSGRAKLLKPYNTVVVNSETLPRTSRRCRSHPWPWVPFSSAWSRDGGRKGRLVKVLLPLILGELRSHLQATGTWQRYRRSPATRIEENGTQQQQQLQQRTQLIQLPRYSSKTQLLKLILLLQVSVDAAAPIPAAGIYSTDCVRTRCGLLFSSTCVRKPQTAAAAAIGSV